MSNFIEYLPDVDKPKEEWQAAEFDLLLEEFRTAINLVNKAEEARNSLVHSNWLAEGMGEPSGTVIRTKTSSQRKKIMHSWEYMTAENILKIVDDIEAAMKAISECVNEIVLHITLIRTNLQLPDITEKVLGSRGQIRMVTPPLKSEAPPAASRRCHIQAPNCTTKPFVDHLPPNDVPATELMVVRR